MIQLDQLIQIATTLSKPGVFCLVNKSKKIIDIRYSSDINLSIASLLKEIRKGSLRPSELLKDFQKGNITMEVLETIEDTSLPYKMIRQRYWMDMYKEQGYTFYRKSKAPVNYKIYTDIVTVKKRERSTVFRLAVYLRTQKYEKTLVGLFSYVKDMEKFIEQYYPKDIPIHNFVYSCSPETTHFYNLLNKKYYRIPKKRRYKYTDEFMKEYNRILLEEENKQD